MNNAFFSTAAAALLVATATSALRKASRSIRNRRPSLPPRRRR